jgi:multidrug resistance protein, MATE family
MWVANGDLLVRTLCLLAGFAWFARLGGQLGPATLAANHLLLQLVAFSAFFLDGFAHVAEARVGTALGGNGRADLRRIVRLTSEPALISALLLSALLWQGGVPVLGLLTTLADVLEQAQAQLPWVALYVLLSVAAFQLDGLCIGAMATTAMRRAAVRSLLLFVPVAWLGQRYAGNPGLWASMVVFVVARALLLWPAWRALQRR